MATKTELLAQIGADIVTHNVCPDLAKTAKNLVLGEGNPDADIVFIGEAPGKKEDELGVPFVGASGKMLQQMLESIGLQRSEVYITNIVKYRPPNNRDPSTVEKQAFMPYLQRQLEVIAPKLIVTLGRHSAQYFIPDLQISTSHGIAEIVSLHHDARQRSLPVTVLPLYHPAAALYNGSLRQTLQDDFAQIPKLVKKLT